MGLEFSASSFQEARENQSKENKVNAETEKQGKEQNEKLIQALQVVFQRHPNITTGATWRFAEPAQQDAIMRDFRQILSLNEDPDSTLMNGNTRTTGLNVFVQVGNGNSRRVVCSFRVISQGDARIISDFRHPTSSN